MPVTESTNRSQLWGVSPKEEICAAIRLLINRLDLTQQNAFIPCMKFGKHISSFLTAIALLWATIFVPTVNAEASHACCPPDMAVQMAASGHMAKMDMETGDHETERACNISCCGLMVNTATLTDIQMSREKRHQNFRQPSGTSQMFSTALAIQSPPPKLV
jgi:hypothetical protein